MEPVRARLVIIGPKTDGGDRRKHKTQNIMPQYYTTLFYSVIIPQNTYNVYSYEKYDYSTVDYDALTVVIVFDCSYLLSTVQPLLLLLLSLTYNVTLLCTVYCQLL